MELTWYHNPWDELYQSARLIRLFAGLPSMRYLQVAGLVDGEDEWTASNSDSILTKLAEWRNDALGLGTEEYAHEKQAPAPVKQARKRHKADLVTEQKRT